jgi:hypothetical protein
MQISHLDFFIFQNLSNMNFKIKGAYAARAKNIHAAGWKKPCAAKSDKLITTRRK